MKKTFNWAGAVLAGMMIYQVIHFVFPSLTEIPFGEWGFLHVFALLTVAYIGKEAFDSKIIAQQLYNGDFLNVAIIMGGLQKTNPSLYRKVMADYRDVILEKQQEAQHIIDQTIKWASNKAHNGNLVSFSVKEERSEIHRCVDLRETLNEVENGEKTWEDVKQAILDGKRYYYTLKVLLNEPKDKITEEAEQQAKIIEEARNKGLNVTFKD